MSTDFRSAKPLVIAGALLAGPWPLLANGQQTNAISAQIPLEEIVVTSSRIPTPLRELGTAISVIGADEIELRGYNSLADILRTQPGIGVSNTGGQGKATSVRIRGEEGYRTLVMIDGIEVSDPTGTQVGPDFSHLVTTSEIQRVEILRGPQGFIYGADAGGIVNIMTRVGEGDLGAQADLELGKFATQKLDANIHGGSESADFFVSIADISLQGFNSRAADTVLVDDDGYDNTTLHTKLGWNLNDDFRLQLVARDVDARTEFDSCGFPTTHDCVADTEQTTFRLSADYSAGDYTHLFAYARTDINRDNFADGIAAFGTSGSLSRIEYTGSFRPTDQATLVYGVDLKTEAVITTDGNDLSRDQDAVYFEAQGRLSNELFVTAGARRDYNDDFGTHDSVRVTAAYLQTLASGSTIKYRAGYGSGFRAPSLSEIAYNAGPFAFPPAQNIALKEESSDGFDIGVAFTREDGLSLEATYFDQRIEDEIFFDLGGFSGYLQSLGINESKGVELAAQIPVGPRWNLLGNVTRNETNNSEGLQRIRRPELTANFGLGYVSVDSKLRLLANLRISRDAVDEIFGTGRVPLDDYQVLDISGTYRWSEGIELFGQVENVTDENYAEVIGFLVGGTAVSAGVRLRF